MTKVLVMKQVDKNLKADYNNFKYPNTGFVKDPDFMADKSCGHGLHGFLWGEGDYTFANYSPENRWLVISVDEEQIVDLNGKVKFRSGDVVFCGDLLGAATFIQRFHGIDNWAPIGGVAAAGDRGTATAKDYGTAIAGREGTATVGVHGMATAGDNGTAIAGDHGTAIAGREGTATVGVHGMATAGDHGTATAGSHGTATVGFRGKATAGHRGTAVVGYLGTATAGHRGALIFNWYDSLIGRRRTVTAYVGENGILPDVPYICKNGVVKPKP